MRSRLGTAVLALALPLAVAGPAHAGSQPGGQPGGHRGQHAAPALTWQEHDTPSTESLRGLDAVNRRTAWVAGDGGGVWRTTDGGASWSDVAPADSEGLLFRDVEAFSADKAVVLAIGEGQASRIYRTDDGGQTWDTTFVNQDPRRVLRLHGLSPAAAAAWRWATPWTGGSRCCPPATGVAAGSCCPPPGCRPRSRGSSRSPPAAPASRPRAGTPGSPRAVRPRGSSTPGTAG